MTDKNDNQCGHSLCSCTVAEDASYCSPNCQAASDSGTTSIACECGHTGCAAEIAQTV
ncbi:MAG: hypothetical protein HY231_00305 [Acidobacteria bacterium]|nr:hypothetical protein [Acidobacteriota bacterium]